MRRIVLLSIALCASRAFADPPGLTPLAIPPPTPAPENYRLQIVAADGLAAGLFILGAAQHGESGQPAALLGTAGFVFGGPIVHLFHHRSKRAAQSLGLRVGLPVFGGVVGWYVGPKQQCYYADAGGGAPPLLPPSGGCGDSGSVAGAVLGVLAGAVTASIVDTAVLAKPDEVVPAQSWSPTVAASPSGWSFGVRGAF